MKMARKPTNLRKKNFPTQLILIQNFLLLFYSFYFLWNQPNVSSSIPFNMLDWWRIDEATFGFPRSFSGLSDPINAKSSLTSNKSLCVIDAPQFPCSTLNWRRLKRNNQVNMQITRLAAANNVALGRRYDFPISTDPSAQLISLDIDEFVTSMPLEWSM